MKALLVAMLALGLPAFGHRLDEYLQATLLSIDSDRLRAEMTLTPGVAVLPRVLEAIDTNGDGAISETEQRAYAKSVLANLKLVVDGQPATPQLNSLKFPPMADLKEGRGEIHINFEAELPIQSGNRIVTLENRHQPEISVYLVNSLVPKDSLLEIYAQKRNHSQSQYELDYVVHGIPMTSIARSEREQVWLGAIALLMAGSFILRLALRNRRRGFARRSESLVN